MNPQTTLRLARAGFVLFCALLGVSLASWFGAEWLHGALAGALFGGVIATLDVLLMRFTIGPFSSATFGLMIGVFCAWLITRVNLPELWSFGGLDDTERLRNRNVFELAVYLTFGFLGITLALRSNREEFALIIPYVRFRQEGLEEQRLLVDTNILIDGRLPAICETGFLNGAMIVPRFVLDEVHLLADSPDPVRRERGRRGVECLEQLRANPAVDVRIFEEFQPQDRPVDIKLVGLAKNLGTRLLTNDANLGRVAALQGVPTLNLNQLAKALRPQLMAGDEIDLVLLKEGKDPHQAVGYLPDGTMVVVNHAINHLGSTVPVVIGGSLQTSAGRLFFAELRKRPNGS